MVIRAESDQQGDVDSQTLRDRAPVSENSSQTPDESVLNDTQDIDEKHRVAERAHWRWQNCIQAIALVLSAIAVAATIKTYVLVNDTLGQTRRQADAAWVQIDEMRRSGRAWLGQTDAKIYGPLAPDRTNYESIGAGKYFYIATSYRNSGQEPAVNVTFLPVNVRTYTPASWNNGIASSEIIDLQKTCRSESSIGTGNIVFPDQMPTTIVSDFSDPARMGGPMVMSKEAMSSEQVMVFLYCVFYKTAGSQHHTAFGYFYWRDHTPLEHLGIVPVGNDAD